MKWAPAASSLDLGAEAIRLGWAAAYSRVPRVLDQGADPAGTWLATSPLPGETAVSDRWKTQPSRAVKAIGRGLRAFHDLLPVTPCPFSWSAEDRFTAARERARVGQVDPARWHDLNRGHSVREALDLLADVPPVDRLVVCHGDACAPNTLIGWDGNWSGHVDLGRLGVADRWADLAIATWSTEWNYGPGWEATLLAAYGIAPDPDRTRYYRLLWDV